MGLGEEWPSLQQSLTVKEENISIETIKEYPIQPIQKFVLRKKKRAPEGIDKIKVTLNQYYLNHESNKKNIDPRNRLTLHHSGPFIMLAVHAEYIKANYDIHISLAKAVYDLIQLDIINLDIIKNYDKTKALYFIYTHLDCFIISISELEFFLICDEKLFLLKKKLSHMVI